MHDPTFYKKHVKQSSLCYTSFAWAKESKWANCLWELQSCLYTRIELGTEFVIITSTIINTHIARKLANCLWELYSCLYTRIEFGTEFVIITSTIINTHSAYYVSGSQYNNLIKHALLLFFLFTKDETYTESLN